MKLYTRALCGAICLTVLLSGQAMAKTQYSPKYKIAYDAQGWDDLSESYVEKRAKKIRRKHGAAAEADFRFQVERLRHFGKWVDDQWEAITLKWSRCYNVGRVSPRPLRILVEDGTWTRPDYPEVKAIWGTVDHSGLIRLTAWSYIPNRGWCVNAVDTLAWEFGNYYQMQLLGVPNDVNKEIGSGDPCRR